jgi:hypothetical protein
VKPTVGYAAASISAAGLYLASDVLGYWNGSAWRTFMDSNGNFYLGGASGALQWAAASNTLTILGVIKATSGYFGDSANRCVIEAAGLSVGSTGAIRGGQTAYNTGTGFWFGNDAGTYKFSIGVAASVGVRYDGTNFDIVKARVGTLTALAGSILVDSNIQGLNVSGAGGLFYPGRTDATGGYQTTVYLGAKGTDLTTNGGMWFAAPCTITSAADGCLTINCTIAGGSANTQINFLRNGTVRGSITSTSSATAYNTSSDARLKTDVTPTRYGLADLRRIAIHDFAFLADEERIRQTGVMGQELALVYPEAVTLVQDLYMVDYSKLVPLLIRAVQELAERMPNAE